MKRLERPAEVSLPDPDTHNFSFLEHLTIPPETSAGRYRVRFAKTTEEVMAAQALRYRVFYVENCGHPSAEKIAAERDMDQWDKNGFHIIVLDSQNRHQPRVVGTLRMFLNEYLQPNQHFYTEEVFNLNKLHSFYHRSLELSRFCVDSNGLCAASNKPCELYTRV